MMKRVVFVVLLFFVMGKSFAQEEVIGRVLTSDGLTLEQVLVVNMQTGVKAMTNDVGEFRIFAKATEELRLVRKGYERISYQVKNNDFENGLVFKMQKSAIEIEEVVIAKVSKEKMEKLQESIGVPQTTWKPREKVSEMKHVLLPLLVGQLNLQAIQDLASGDSRRRKTLYKYEDFQEKVYWIKDRIEAEFFTEKGIPEERIIEFITFAITEKTELNHYIKTRNLIQIRNLLEKVLPI